MFLMVDKATRQILDASDLRKPVNEAVAEIVEIPGVTEMTYPFPGGEPLRCRCAEDGTITYDSALDVDAVRDAYRDAKQAMTTFAADSTLANAKPALLKLGICVEQLLLALNRRIA